jgi:flagellar M-ring protein FliF
MAADSPNLFSRFENLSGLPVIRQIGLLFGLALSLALGLGLVQWAMTPEFTPLYAELSPTASVDVVRNLEAGGIPFKVNQRNGLISVPADQVHQVRLNLASEGLPEGDGSGFEMLYKEQEMGISSFMEKARFDRALEQELSKSIASLDSIKSARVHLALPKPSAFVRKKSKVAASVILNLFSGRELTERQLAGVMHLVAFSVPGLEASQVSVVDNRGTLLSSRNNDNDFAFSGEQFQFARQLEQSYVDRIVEILTPIVGSNSVRAQVAADVNFTRIERTIESYDPESSIRSEQTVQENSPRAGASGVPGTLSILPPDAGNAAGAPADGAADTGMAGRTSIREIRNYELDKTISHIRESPGTITKLSVAVVLDYVDGVNAEGVAERQALSEQRLAEVTQLVKEVVGFDERRGDKVEVLNASFIQSPELEEMPEPSLLEQNWFWRSIKIASAGLVIILVIFVVLRPLMKASTIRTHSVPALNGPAGQQGQNSLQAPHALGGVTDDQVTIGGQQQMGLPGAVPAYQQQLTMARSMVEGEPERAAQVVKTWLAADG